MAKKTNALAAALVSSGAKVAAPMPPAEPAEITSNVPTAERRPLQASRVNMRPLTVQQPEDVRRQLKTMAAEQGRTMEDLVAEALNLLFVQYRKPELASRKA